MCLSVATIPIGLIVGIQGFNASILFLILIFVVTFCFSLLISHLITRPIIGLTKNLENLSKGQLDIKLDKSEIHEINNLTESLDRIMASLKLAIYKFDVKKGEIFEDDIKSKDYFETKQENNLNPHINNIKIAQGNKRNISKKISDHKIKINKIKYEQRNEKNKICETASDNKEKINEEWSEQKNDSVFFFDDNANILDCNKNMYKNLGYSKEEILCLNMADFDVLETKKDLSKKINIAKKNGSYSFKTVHKRKDGSTFLVFENLQYIKDKNTFKCIIRED